MKTSDRNFFLLCLLAGLAVLALTAASALWSADALKAAQTAASPPNALTVFLRLVPFALPVLALVALALHVSRRSERRALTPVLEEAQRDLHEARNALDSQIGKHSRIEASLSQREETFRMITAAANDGMIILDEDLKVSFWNAAAERIFGYSWQEIWGKGIVMLLADEQTREVFVESLKRSAAPDGKEPPGRTLELTGRRRDGSDIPLEASISSVRLNDTTHAVAIVRDVLERKQSEQALREAKEATEAANRELEQAITRANDLARKAEEANEAKSQFLANMSHEIRTPLNGVIGMTEVLMGTDLDAEQRECAQTVRLAGETLLSLINDILDFSKIEAGRMDLERIDFDLRVALDQVVEMLSFRALQKNNRLTGALHPDVPSRVVGDPGRLRQILVNLVNNAIKFTDHGGVSVEGFLVRETPDSATIRFEVADTGIGIPADRRHRLFESFSQVDASTTRRYGGTGLGLAISKRLSEMMGGEIGVESVEGEGSTFWFTCVLKKQKSAAEPPSGAPAELKDRRVLVVDGDPTNRDILRRVLASWKMRPVMARNAEEGGRLLRETIDKAPLFDLAVLDMHLPDGTGEELAASMRREGLPKETRFVMLTSVGARGDGARALKAGFAGYLPKPVRQDNLRECFQAVLRQIGESGRTSLVTRHSLAEERRRSFRILLAEDNLVNQKVATKILEKLGLPADVVGNGRLALEALQTRKYDLVLMDCSMPEMDGYAATRAIREREAEGGGHVPIIAMTAHAMQGDREKCLEAGMDDYLSKPISSIALNEALERHLSRMPARGDEPLAVADARVET